MQQRLCSLVTFGMLLAAPIVYAADAPVVAPAAPSATIAPTNETLPVIAPTVAPTPTIAPAAEAPVAAAAPATGGPAVTAVLVKTGYYKADDCKPEADPKLVNECICKADIHKAQATGLAPNIAEVINTQLSQVPEQLSSESCSGGQISAPDGKVSVNEVTANYETLYQSPASLTVLVTYTTFGAGAAHAIMGSEGYTFSLASGKTILPTETMTPEQRAKASTFVQEELLKKYGESLLDEAKSRTEPYFTDAGCENCTMYYTKDGWNVRFQLYAVAPYAAGEPTIVIPTSIIPDPETLMARKK